jgi:hypothetical protein
LFIFSKIANEITKHLYRMETSELRQKQFDRGFISYGEASSNDAGASINEGQSIDGHGCPAIWNSPPEMYLPTLTLNFVRRGKNFGKKMNAVDVRMTNQRSGRHNREAPQFLTRPAEKFEEPPCLNFVL